MSRSGWILTGLLLLFLVPASVVPKLLGLEVAVESMAAIGWSPQHLLLIGLIELAALVLFVVPRTGLLGAVMMTALLGGALASHLRAGSPMFSHTLFSVYLGLAMWAALWLRDAALRQLFPLRS